MPTWVWKDAKLYMDQYDLSGIHNQMSFSMEADEAEDTNFASGGSREFLPGLIRSAISHAGFWSSDDVSGNPETYLFNALAGSNNVVSASVTGVDGDPAYTVLARHTSYSPEGEAGGMFRFSMNASATDRLVRGTIMSTGAKTVTGTGTARQLGAAAAGQRVYAALHVLAASGTTPSVTVVVESDDAEVFSSPVTRVSFDAASAVGAQWKTAAGPVTDTWWRVKYTISGTTPSLTIAVVVGIV